MFKFSNSSYERMQGVHPDIVLVFMVALANSPIDFGIPAHGGVRTAATQNKLFNEGVSKCDGYELLSNHQVKEGDKYGMALDFYAYVNGHASWEEHHLSMVAGVILSTAKKLKSIGAITLDLEWGGTFGSENFSGWDMPHIQGVTSQSA